jgi:hypothetical protein
VTCEEVKLHIPHATFQNFPFVVLVSCLNISSSKQYLILCVCARKREREREREKERKIDSGPFGACWFSCRICSSDLLGVTDRSLECRRQYRIMSGKEKATHLHALVGR